MRLAGIDNFKAVYLRKYRRLLDDCETRLAAVAAAPQGALGDACSETLSAGGKRFRPLLVFLCAGDSSRTVSGHMASAVAVELVHMASLVHDDVLDAAAMRRGRETVYSAYGSEVSSAAGDYLFSSAFRVLAGTGSPVAVSLLTNAGLELSRGELVQMSQAYNFNLSRAEYSHRCSLKTGSLFAASCRMGALFAGYGSASQEAFGRYGYLLGQAFQIADDILDFSPDSSMTGKLAGTDLRDGTVTLPLIHALEADDGLEQMCRRLHAGLQEPVPASGKSGQADPDELVDAICSRVRESGSLESARQDALRTAQEAAGILPAGELYDPEPLRLIAEMAADRKV